MTIEGRCFFAIAFAGVSLTSARGADAQVHWDVGIQAGVTGRLTTGDATMPTPTPGPSGEIHGHVAVIPMLRVGPYAAFDLSPAPGTTARQIYAAGLRAKVTPPLLSAPWHAWVFAGVGYADAYTARYQPANDVVVRGVSTGMLELPVGVGAGYKLRGPWELHAELGARVVVARGSVHSVSSGNGNPFTPLVSDDLLAVSLSVGVSLAP
jgi:hypothetical protein